MSTDGEIVDVNVIIILAAGSHNLFIEKKASNRFELKLNSNLPGMMIPILLYSCILAFILLLGLYKNNRNVVFAAVLICQCNQFISGQI